MKTNLDSLFKTNEDLEKDGVIFEIDSNTWFKLRRMGGHNSSKIRKALTEYYKPYARQIQLRSLDEKIEQEIAYKVFFEACVVDWKGIEIDGEVADCTMDNAVKLFQELPSLYETLEEYVKDLSNFKDDLGNF